MPVFEFEGQRYQNPVELAQDVIGGKWKMPILWRLDKRVWRYNELRRELANVSHKMLTQHLRELEHHGLITRTVHPVVPPHVDYAITPLGRTTLPLIEALRAWGTMYRRTRLRQTLTGLALFWILSSPVVKAFDPPPSLVVIGIDAFRPDYLERANVPSIRALAARGVRAEGLIPPFPSKTFPSFLTIATGLRPARHGIVNNTIDDPAIPVRFRLSDHPARSDPRWWLGEPIWNTAERQGVRAAGIFWPGDDVEILGRRPSSYLTYDESFPNERRIDRALALLAQPPATRPQLLMLYVSLVDDASHAHGPHSPEAHAAAAAADALVARLLAGLESRGLTSTVNVAVVSDHGMAETTPDRVIVLDNYLDPASVDVIETGPSVRLRPRGDATLTPEARRLWTVQTMRALRGKHPRLRVYPGTALPPRFEGGTSVRIPPVVGMADDGWLVQTRAQLQRWRERGGETRGEHGFDPGLASMRGVFVAAGPSFRVGTRLPAVESVHLYEMFCRVLGITPGPNDGSPRVLAAAIR